MYVSLERQQYHYQLHIARPDRMNGLGVSIGKSLLDRISEVHNELAQGNEKQRLLVLSAETVERENNKGIWIAGGDLKEIAALSTSTMGDSYSQTYHQICNLLESLPIPVLAAIDGHVIGGGIELSLAADLRFATRRSQFLFKQIQMGLATGYGGGRRLVEIVGISRASYWLLSCQNIDSETALASGLIHELVDGKASLEQRVQEIARQVSGFNFQSLAKQKAMLRHAVEQSRLKALENERSLFAELWMSPGHKQALSRFQQAKRSES